jgi:adenylosuccinate synthase
MNKINADIRALLNGVKTAAVIGGQFGDEGKGKFGDAFAEWADVIARGTGGANAGHTITLNEKEYIFHLIPSGILHDKDGKKNIIGSGTAFDPGVVCEELELLREEGVSYNNLRFSMNAHLVLPQHLVMDRTLEQCEGKIGTTGRGIGPVYQDHYARMGLRLNDLLNKDEFARKLTHNLRDKRRFLKTMDPETVKAVMHHPHLRNGRFWNAAGIFDEDAIVETYMAYAQEIKVMICDTDDLLRQELRTANILLEGAQATMLSVDYGTYPHVTASDCTVRGLAKGVGLPERAVDLALSVVKAFYMTRVGEGPFPTEMGGEESAVWCGTKGVNKKTELERFGQLTVNYPNHFLQGIGIRMAGNEYGATTGRPRRTGWLDLPMLRYSLQHSGPDVILTKLDVLDQCEEIKICTEYVYDGPGYQLGAEVVRNGDCFSVAVPHSHMMKHSKPIFETYPGWLRPIGHIRSYIDLPEKLRTIIEGVAQAAGFKPRIISVGRNREQTIVVA